MSAELFALVAPDAKTCRVCKRLLPIDQFRRSPNMKSGRRNECRECGVAAFKAWRVANPEKDRAKQRRETLKMYGISRADYDRLHAAQGGRCAICGGVEHGHKRAYFAIDHDHASGVVRGLLCHGCNAALGGFRDNPDLLRSAAKYVEAFLLAQAAQAAK